MKTFTEDEKIIARNIDKGYKWIARDSNGNLGVYKGKTKKKGYYWYSDGDDYLCCFNHLFPAIKWEDEEPTRISDIYNPQILDDAEREYLKTVLKPFHEAVKYVEKLPEHVFDEDNRSKEYLVIAFYGRGAFSFPDFYAGEMYSGMELDKEYELDELGITYEAESEDKE